MTSDNVYGRDMLIFLAKKLNMLTWLSMST